MRRSPFPFPPRFLLVHFHYPISKHHRSSVATPTMCPPGVDQTMRSPQTWYMIAPELLQAHKTQQPRASYDDWRTNSRDLQNKLFNPKIQYDTWGKLARPDTTASNVNLRLYSAKVFKACSKLSALEKLSNELLDLIIQHLAPKKADIVALGLSSRHLWLMILHHIHAGYLKAKSPWAGKMIAFQGSYSTDLPEPFKETGLVESITGSPTSWFGNMCQARRFFWAHRYEAMATPYSQEAEWITAVRSHQEDSKIPEACWWTIEEVLECSYLFPKNQEWLLRNLTSRETVSSKVLREAKTKKTRSSKFPVVSFDDVVLMKSISLQKEVPIFIHSILTCKTCSMLDEHSIS